MSTSISEPIQRLHIRRYEASDKRAVRRLHDDALNEVGAHLGSGPWDEDLNEIGEVYLESGGEFLVGVLEGEVVAMGALKRLSPDAAEIKRMRVHPRWQGHGFGRTLLERLEARARELGFTTLRLDTTARQHAARALYEDAGYQLVGTGHENGFELVYYEKRLA